MLSCRDPCLPWRSSSCVGPALTHPSCFCTHFWSLLFDFKVMRREVISLDSPAPSLGAEIGLSSSSLQVRFKCGFVLDQLTCPHSISKRIYIACSLCIYYRKWLLWHLPEDITPAPPPHLTFQRQTSWERSSESLGAAVWVAVLYCGPFPPGRFPCGSAGKECLQCRRPGFDPWVGKIAWRTEMGRVPFYSIRIL